MTTQQQDTPIPAPIPGLASLRGNCMGAAVLLIVQFALGIGVNLYVTLPAHKAFFSTVFGSAVLATHVIVALLLLGASISALVRAIRSKRAIVFTALGVAAIVIAWIGGSSFVSNQSNGASLTMALATAAGMFSYLAAVFSLR
jgi:hypothetical protein